MRREWIAPAGRLPILGPMLDQRLLTTLRRSFRGRSEDLVCAYLFSSRARGEALQGSDVDVAVHFAAAPPEPWTGCTWVWQTISPVRRASRWTWSSSTVRRST
jgi:hypothetical protein